MTASQIQLIAAIVQALAAAVIVWLTMRLTRSTETYARLTRESLDVSRQQFEREWLPYWHLGLLLDTSAPTVEISLQLRNLSRNSARVTHLFLRVESEPGSKKQWYADLALAGLEKETFDITSQVNETIKRYILGGSWKGVIEVSVGFVVAHTDEPRPSKWFAFHAALSEGKVIEIRPKVPYVAADLSE